MENVYNWMLRRQRPAYYFHEIKIKELTDLGIAKSCLDTGISPKLIKEN